MLEHLFGAHCSRGADWCWCVPNSLRKLILLLHELWCGRVCQRQAGYLHLKSTPPPGHYSVEGSWTSLRDSSNCWSESKALGTWLWRCGISVHVRHSSWLPTFFPCHFMRLRASIKGLLQGKKMNSSQNFMLITTSESQWAPLITEFQRLKCI